jgi:DNA-binding NarL/FixJ family response regulator
MVSKEGIRVLIADDHPAVRVSLHRLLDRQEDIQVVGEAANGEEALRMAEEVLPQVLLLDIEMPVMDGIEVARRLCCARSPVRILILSGYADEEYIRMVMEQGVYGYLIKDEPPVRIAEAIRQVAFGKKIGRKALSVQDYSLGYRGLRGNLG